MAHDAAANTWRSRTLPVALAQWAVVCLGDGESRRRRQAWRHALLQAPLFTDQDEIERGEDDYRLDEIHTAERGDRCANAKSSLCDGKVHKLGDDHISLLETQSPPPPPPPLPHETTTGTGKGFISAVSAEARGLGWQCGAAGDGRDEEGEEECGTSDIEVECCESTKTARSMTRPSGKPCKDVHRKHVKEAGAIVSYQQAIGAEQKSVLGWVGLRAEDGQGEPKSTKAAGRCRVEEIAPDYNANRCTKPEGVLPVTERGRRRHGDRNADGAQPPEPSVPGSVADGRDAVLQPTESRPGPGWSSRVQDITVAAESSNINSDIIVWRVLENEDQIPPKGPPPGSPQGRRSAGESPGVFLRPLAMRECASGVKLLEDPAAVVVVAETSPAADGVQEEAEGSRESFVGSDTRDHGDEWVGKAQPNGGSAHRRITEMLEEDRVEGWKEGEEDSTPNGRAGGDINGYRESRKVGLSPASLAREVPSITTPVAGEDTLGAFVAQEVEGGRRRSNPGNVSPVDGPSNLSQSPPNDAGHNPSSFRVEDTELTHVVSIVEQDEDARSVMERRRRPTPLDHRLNNFTLTESGSSEAFDCPEPQSPPTAPVVSAAAGMFCPRESRMQHLGEANGGQRSLAPDAREEADRSSVGVCPFSGATLSAEGGRCIIERSRVPGSAATLCCGSRLNWEFVSGQVVGQVTNATSDIVQGWDAHVLPDEAREARVGVEVLDDDNDQVEEGTPERVEVVMSVAASVGTKVKSTRGGDSHPDSGLNLGPHSRPVGRERATEGSRPRASERWAQDSTGAEDEGGVFHTLVAELALASTDCSGALSSLGPPSAQSGTLEVTFDTKSDCGAAPPAFGRSAERSLVGPGSSVVSGCFLHKQDQVSTPIVEVPTVLPSAIVTEKTMQAVTTPTAMQQRGCGRRSTTSRESTTLRDILCRSAVAQSSHPGSSDNGALSPDSGLGAAGPREPHAPTIACGRKHHPQRLSLTFDLQNPSSRSDQQANIQLEATTSAGRLTSARMPEHEVGLQWSQRAEDSTSGGGGSISSAQSSGESNAGRWHDESIAMPGQRASFPPVLAPGAARSASTLVSCVAVAEPSDLEVFDAHRILSDASQLLQQGQPPALPTVPATSPCLTTGFGAKPAGNVARSRQPAPCGDASSAGEPVGLGNSYAATASRAGGGTGELCGQIRCGPISGRDSSTGGGCPDDGQVRGGRREFISASPLSAEYSSGDRTLLGKGHQSSRYHHVLTVGVSASSRESESSIDPGDVLSRPEGLFHSLTVRDLPQRSEQNATSVGARESTEVLDVATPSGGNPCIYGRSLHATGTIAGPPVVTDEAVGLAGSSEAFSLDAFGRCDSRAAAMGRKDRSGSRSSDPAIAGGYGNGQRVGRAGISNSRNIVATLEPLATTSPSTLDDTRDDRISSSSRRGRGTLLQERVSEAFVRRRLREIGLR